MEWDFRKILNEKWLGIVHGKVVLLLTVVMILWVGPLVLAGQNQSAGDLYYECILIRSGDTIWNIAEEYKYEGQKTEHMVREIMSMNGMVSENIRSGDRIIVPLKK
ncbi:MAG: LysM peptidoglycan-binding domain-containing protein [Anaerotignum sp.]